VFVRGHGGVTSSVVGGFFAPHVEEGTLSALAIADIQTPAVSSVGMIVRYMREHPLSAIVESVLRTIAAMLYREGVCYAAQCTIARLVGRAKSTIQLALDELEGRGLIRRTVREGTSHLIHLADGVIEALREIRLARETKKLRGRGVPSLAGSFTALALPPTKPEIRESEGADLSPKPQGKELRTTNRPEAPLEPRKHSTSLPYIYNQSSSAPVKAQDDDASTKVEKKTVVEQLIAEGVTPPRARSFADLFGPQRILRNIRIGLHRAKHNPAGYLITAIQHDYAAGHIKPGSEAERVRKRELPGGRIAPPELISTSPAQSTPKPQTVADDVAQRYGELAAEQQSAYESRAQESLLSTIGGIVNQGTIFGAMVRARAVEFFRRDQLPERQPHSSINGQPTDIKNATKTPSEPQALSHDDSCTEQQSIPNYVVQSA
jgi:DNA-binding MarR family transcriptional regulator